MFSEKKFCTFKSFDLSSGLKINKVTTNKYAGTTKNIYYTLRHNTHIGFHTKSSHELVIR